MAKPYSRILAPRVTAWTADRLIERIHAWYDIERRTPYATDWNPALARRRGFPERAERFERDGCWPYVTAFERMEFPGFGRGFSAGIRAAGFEPRLPGLSTALAESDGTKRADRERRAPGPKGAARAERDREIRALVRKGVARAEIAQRYGLSITRIHTITRDLGRSQSRAIEQAATAARMIRAGARTEDIMRTLGYTSRASFYERLYILRGRGYDIPTRGKRWAEHAAEIAEMVREGKSNAEIAQRYGVDHRYLSTILTKLRRDGHDIPYRLEPVRRDLLRDQ